MKRKIKLTESDLHNIIKGSVTSILNEISIKDNYQKEKQNKQNLEGQFKVLGSTSTYSVIQPLTFEAERYFGSAHWGTTLRKDIFEHYNKIGTLFILLPKKGNKKGKMQFHFESNSFADYDDRIYETPLECMENIIHNDEELSELTELCANIWKDKAHYFIRNLRESISKRKMDMIIESTLRKYMKK